MTINFTIFVQAIHFFLAYLIITKFFIKPALDLLIQEEENDAKLLLELNSEIKKFQEKDKIKLDLWKESLIQFSFHKPDVDKLRNKIQVDWPNIKTVKPTEADISLLTKEVANFLKDKISHVE